MILISSIVCVLIALTENKGGKYITRVNWTCCKGPHAHIQEHYQHLNWNDHFSIICFYVYSERCLYLFVLDTFWTKQILLHVRQKWRWSYLAEYIIYSMFLVNVIWMGGWMHGFKNKTFKENFKHLNKTICIILSISYLIIYTTNPQKWDKYLFQCENWWHLAEKRPTSYKRASKTSHVLESNLKCKNQRLFWWKEGKTMCITVHNGCTKLSVQVSGNFSIVAF